MAIQDLVNFRSSNGLLPDGTKPLPEPMFINHLWSLEAITYRNFTGNAQDIYPWYECKTNVNNDNDNDNNNNDDDNDDNNNNNNNNDQERDRPLRGTDK